MPRVLAEMKSAKHTVQGDGVYQCPSIFGTERLCVCMCALRRRVRIHCEREPGLSPPSTSPRYA